MSASGRCARALQVDDHVAQDPVEPCVETLLVVELVDLGQRLEQAVLDGIGGESGIADALAREGDELVEPSQQRIDGRGHA